MFKINDLEFADLNSAMEHAKSMNEFVVIKGDDFEACGIFGVDSVENGKTPDGSNYTWNKKNRIGRTKRER